MRIAFVFPGQGSQSVGMLSGFADNAVVADYMARANAALGEDLVKLIAEGPAENPQAPIRQHHQAWRHDRLFSAL